MSIKDVYRIVHQYLRRTGVPICQEGICYNGQRVFAFFLLTRSDELSCHLERLRRQLRQGNGGCSREPEPKWLGPPHDYGTLRIAILDNPFHHEDDPHDKLAHFQLDYGVGNSAKAIYRTIPVGERKRIKEAVRQLLRQRERAAD